LLANPARTTGNYRLYGKEDLERLEFILHCRRHGMGLDEIRELLAFRDCPRPDCTWITELIDSHIAGVDRQIVSLGHLKEHLERLRRRCSGGHHGNDCGILRSLDNPASCCASCDTCASGASGRPAKAQAKRSRSRSVIPTEACAVPARGRRSSGTAGSG
jgi:DNA-binding transcriptional MerR regulator